MQKYVVVSETVVDADSPGEAASLVEYFTKGRVVAIFPGYNDGVNPPLEQCHHCSAWSDLLMEALDEDLMLCPACRDETREGSPAWERKNITAAGLCLPCAGGAHDACLGTSCDCLCEGEEPTVVAPDPPFMIF